MFYGWERYEIYQNIAPAKVLAGLILLKLNGEISDDDHIRELACEILGVQVHNTHHDKVMTNDVVREMVSVFMAKKAEIPMTEPVFLLRPVTDPVGIKSVETWIANAKATGVSSDRIQSAEAQLERIRQYISNSA